MIAKNISLDGKEYVILSREDYDRMARIAKLPPLPEPNEHGEYPAVEYARVSLARKFILRREALGISQAELSRRAGIRAETLCRIESGKVTPTLTSVEKIDRALKKAEA